MASENSILESPPFRISDDGTFERSVTISHVPATDHRSVNGLRSKDVVISRDPDISARLFLPELPPSGKKLPILVYYHGGAWCIESAFSKLYDDFVSTIAPQAGVLAVSVEYRLAPETPIPAPYQDCWSALQWVIRQSNAAAPDAEPWLAEHGDFDRVFLSGDSAGGNLTHHMAMCAGGAPSFTILEKENNIPVKVTGIVVIQPFFLGSPPQPDRLWDFFCPEIPSVENPLPNLVAPSSPPIDKLGCRHVLLFLAGKDHLRDRGQWYAQLLKNSGWDGEVEVVVHDGEGHVFHLFKPECENAKDLVKRMAGFLNPEKMSESIP